MLGVEKMDAKNEIIGNWDNVLFQAKPNFKFQEEFSQTVEALAGNSNIEVYKKGDKTYLVCSLQERDEVEDYDGKNDIVFYELPDYKEEPNHLIGHKERVMNIRYFYNPENKKEYLVSSDRTSKVIVWDLDTFKQVGKTICTNYDTFIYSCILVFRGEKIFVVTSCIGGKQCDLFELEEGKPIENVGPSDAGGTYYLMYWKRNENEDYIVQCSKSNVYLSRVPLNKEGKSEKYGQTLVYNVEREAPINQGGLICYAKLEEGAQRCYLVVTSTYGYITFFDITKPDNSSLSPVKKIKLEKAHLYNVFQWDEDYIIVNNGFDEKLEIIDISMASPEIVSEVRCKEFSYERFLKKVVHPKYGESLFSVNPYGKVKLWVNKDLKIN